MIDPIPALVDALTSKGVPAHAVESMPREMHNGWAIWPSVSGFPWVGFHRLTSAMTYPMCRIVSWPAALERLKALPQNPTDESVMAALGGEG